MVTIPSFAPKVREKDRELTHNVKTKATYFTLAWQGFKNVEIRINDRDYRAGDTFVQWDFYPSDDPLSFDGGYSDGISKGTFSGRRISARIALVLKTLPGLAPGYVLLCFDSITRHDAQKGL